MTAIPTSETAMVPFLRRIFSRVGLKLTLVLTALIIFVELVVLVPSYFGLKRDLLDQSRSEALAVFSATLQTNAATHEGLVGQIGRFLSEHGFIRGGTLYDVNGDEHGRFGEPPALDLAAVVREEVVSRAGDDGRSQDFFIPVQETGLNYHAILRTDTSWIHDRLNRYFINVGLIVLFLALACICGISVALDTILLSRLLGMHNAATDAGARPDIADRFVLNDRSSDEVGELARAVDSLLVSVSQSYQDDLTAAVEINRSAPQAVLIYGPDFNLVGANEAALTLYNVASVDLLTARTGALLVCDKGADMEILEAAAEEPYSGRASARGAGGHAVSCDVYAQAVNGPDGTILRFVIYLSDRSEALTSMHGVENRARLAEGRVGRLHDALEACIAIITAETGGPPEEPVRIAPERAFTAWVDEMETSGRFSRGDLRYEALPPVMLPPDCTDELFRNILSLSLIRIGEKGRVSVSAETGDHDGTCRFLFSARPSNPGANRDRPANEVSVIEAAVRKLAARSDGAVEISEHNHGAGEWRLLLTLPAAKGGD